MSFAGARSQITQHFTNAKRPQRRRAKRNGCFRRLNNSWIKKSKIAFMGQTMSCPRRINRLRHRRLETSVRCHSGGGRQENKILKEILHHSPHSLRKDRNVAQGHHQCLRSLLFPTVLDLQSCFIAVA